MPSRRLQPLFLLLPLLSACDDSKIHVPPGFVPCGEETLCGSNLYCDSAEEACMPGCISDENCLVEHTCDVDRRVCVDADGNDAIPALAEDPETTDTGR